MFSWECDGDLDCGEGDTSDEHAGCGDVSCLLTQFRCDEYKCIPSDYVCDGELDCNDGQDEAGCAEKCGSGQFYCYADNSCIPQSRVCNGNKTDGCSDGDDEAKCDLGKRLWCEESEFSCRDGSSCVPREFLCDGTRDCLDGSDEARPPTACCCTSEMRLCRHLKTPGSSVKRLARLCFLAVVDVVS